MFNLCGDEKKIEEVVELVENEVGKKVVGDLKKLWNMFDVYGVMDEIKIDFNLVSYMSYYIGILFEVFVENVGFYIGNGGCYD